MFLVSSNNTPQEYMLVFQGPFGESTDIMDITDIIDDVSPCFPESYVVFPIKSHTHTVVFLHGRGSNGEEFASDLLESLVPSTGKSNTGDQVAPKVGRMQEPSSPLTLPQHFPNWKWIFPTTKERYSTTFQEEMNEWFDTVSLSHPSEREELQIQGLAEAVRHIETILGAEIKTIGADKVILGGISQGYATALHVLFVGGRKLAAFVGLSGWIPFARQIHQICQRESGRSAARSVTTFARANLGLESVGADGDEERGSWADSPMFLGHEEYDEIVRCEHGKEAWRILKAVGANVTWHTYESGDHWLKEPEEMEDIVTFLTKYCS